MAKYLKKFETTAQYDAAKSGLILPNVSLITENNKVEYNPLQPTPPAPSHDYVDLGLPSGTKWATMNIGATSITDYGNYYQYGKGAATYQETSGDTPYEGEEDPLAASADTAVQVWGGSWHMPSSAQCQELLENTTYEYTTINGVYGCKFTAQNGQYVFFPIDPQNYHTICYWTSTPCGGDYPYVLAFHDGVEEPYVGNYSYEGYLVRGVLDA